MEKNTIQDNRIFGHPKGLFYLFFAEMWERFSFYGMRALLVLYLTAEIYSGAVNPSEIAFEVYAAYGSLVYFTPVLGGMIADRLIGHKNSIMLGAILMTLGHFIMAIETNIAFFSALGLLIVGNGLFKPNISTIVGGLYPAGDPKKDAGFTIFYMGVNLGAFLSPLVCGWLGSEYGWHYGFAAAGVGMLLGLIVFWKGVKDGIFGDVGNQPEEYKGKKVFAGLGIRPIVYIASFLVVPIFALLVYKNSAIVPVFNAGLMSFLLMSLLIVVLIYLIVTMLKVTKVERDRLIVVVLLTIMATLFWAFFEQGGSSLTLFAETNVNLIGMNAAQTNAINAFFIIALAIPFSLMWVYLDKKKLNPNTPNKFAFGILQLGLGFLLFALSARFMDADGRVPMFFLVIGYFFITTGELFVSPIGLSKITGLSPARLTAFMMGVWFLSSAFAHHIAGFIAKQTGGGGHGHGAEEAVAEVTVSEPGFVDKVASAISGFKGDLSGLPEGVQNLANYTNIFTLIALISFGFGIFLMMVAPLIKKMMHGIK